MASGKITSVDTFDLVSSTIVVESIGGDANNSSFTLTVGDSSHILGNKVYTRIGVTTAGVYTLDTSNDGSSWTNEVTKSVEPLMYRSVRVEAQSTAGLIGSINPLPPGDTGSNTGAFFPFF